MNEIKPKVKDCIGCNGCPMQKLFPDNAFVAPKFGGSRRLVITEAPREEDSLRGEPLVGGHGRWFDNMARKAGLKREDLNITTVLHCRPPNDIFPTDPDARNYISPSDAALSVSHCVKAYLHPMLHARDWQRVDLLGDKPLEFVAEKHEGQFKWRGSPLPIPELGDKPIAITTLDPVYIAKDQELIPCVINDLKKNITVPPENYNLTPSIEDVLAFTAKEFAFDIETRGWTKEITMIGLSDRLCQAMLVPFRGPYIPLLKKLFTEATDLIGQNIVQFDIPVMEENGFKFNPAAQLWDTMLMQHLMFPTFPHDLEFISSQFTNKPAWKQLKKADEPLYCCRDVDVTYQAYRQLRAMLKRENLENVYKYISVPIGKICHKMHTTGFKINPANIAKVRVELLAKMAEAEKALPEQLKTREVMVNKRNPAPPGTLSPKTKKPLKFISTPEPKSVVPWRSPAQKQAYLYGKDEPWMLGFPEQLDPKSGRVTTGKNAIDKLHRKWPELVKEAAVKLRPLTPEVIATGQKSLAALKNLNKWDELITTFCKESMVTKVDRMYPHFNVHGTASGRLSSSEPNLQNIPESARFIYVPTHQGWKILEVDYSQIENRLTAYLAGDVERLDRFVKDSKFSEHKYAASLFLDIAYDDVEKSSDPESPYIKAKKIVHGTNYGEGALKIAKLNDLDVKEVKLLLDKWKNAIKSTSDWQKRTAELASKQGYLVTPFDRKRWFYTSSAYTESLSFLPQSSAADIIFRAMIGLMYQRIGWPEEAVSKVVGIYEPLPMPARLLLQVHDSLLFEYPPELEEKLITTVKRVMEQPWPELGGMSIPIGIKTGPSWGEAEEYRA